MASQYVGIPYKLRGKDPSKGGLDCSGFVCEVVNQLGYNVSGGSENIFSQAKEKYRDNTLMDKVGILQEGDLIAIDSGPTDFDKGRTYGIDHIGIVVKNDKGELMFAESSGSTGVVIRPLKEALKVLETSAKKSSQEDPIFIGRGLPK